MAHKVDPKKSATPAVEDTSAASALVVIKPDVTITVAGREVTVREYGFFEGLEVAHKAQDFIRELHQLAADGRLTYARIRRLFGPYRDLICAIAAKAADVEPEWVRSLESSPDEAELFLDTWYGVNASFFVHEVIVEMREARQLVEMSIGSTPSSASPTPASETSTGSAASQSGS